ncbi:hypothetical protein EV639_101765 [Rathayibacter tanaceti]|nr:hypothetical protein EV639_101765 [Rathayibacter tanaceti]
MVLAFQLGVPMASFVAAGVVAVLGAALDITSRSEA